MEFFEEHTRYEWALLQAAQSVDPCGEERADIRDAINTAAIMSAFAKVDDFGKLVEQLQKYLKIHEQDPAASVKPMDISQIAAIL